MVYARIRELVPTLPILPFTGVAPTGPVLTALGCLPPLLKPVRPGDLAAALRTALLLPLPVVGEHPLIAWAHEQSEPSSWCGKTWPWRGPHLRHLAGQARRAAPILSAVAQTVEAANDGALRTLLAGMRWTALVADADDYVRMRPLTDDYAVPLVLIAATQVQARTGTAAATAVLVETDLALDVKLAAVLEAITVGNLPRDDGDAATTSGTLLPRDVMRQFRDTPLSARELDVLWLDHHGYTLAHIAATLGVARMTVTSHWKHMQRKLNLERRALQAGFQAHLQGEQAS